VVDLIASAIVVRPAPAKINLYLHITGRREDGYHTLESLVVFAGVGDTVEVMPSPALELSVSGPFAAALSREADNLVLRAARALADATGREAQASIQLTKNLPVAAGLGGGSADAAATLLGLCEFWKVAPDAETLAALALRLGADVPACLAREPVLVSGIGEDVRPAPRLPECHVVLVNPGISLSTPEVFAKFAEQGLYGAEPESFSVALGDAESLAEALRQRRNDLEAPAIALAPVIKEVLEALSHSPGCLLARMSGSGASCFGLFADESTAKSVASTLAREQPGWWSAAAPILAPEPMEKVQ
jgi:4-diphosphocytidyl-2-C-methyl-D-erythritol kinase